MTRVLLTGGSGFIAAHTLELLLKNGHSVVTTVRSQSKADKIKEAHPDLGEDRLSTVIVEDIAKEDAFEKAIISDPPFEVVLHTASPFHFNVTDVKKDLLDPAVIGTTGILKAAKKVPSIKHIVITSSFASILTASKLETDYEWSEKDWNPITEQEALADPASGYRASKTFAEKAAWAFVEKEKPGFTISTINPPLVFGPITHYLNSLDSLNTSNQRILSFIRGEYKEKIPDTRVYLWVDVRDVAKAHVAAFEKPDAASKRFFVTAGQYSNKEISEVIRKNFPEYADKLPPAGVDAGGDYPEKKIQLYDNSRAREILGIEFLSLEQSITDLVKTLKAVGA